MKVFYITCAFIFCAIINGNAQGNKAQTLTKLMFESKITKIQKNSFEMIAVESTDKQNELKAKTLERELVLYANLEKEITNVFSESEIAYLVDFYKSPVGKKLLNTSTSFNNATVRVLQEWEFTMEEIVMDPN